MKTEIVTIILIILISTFCYAAGPEYTRGDVTSHIGSKLMYEDLRFSITRTRLDGSRPPAEITFKDGPALEFEDQAVAGNQEMIRFNAQLPHAYAEGEDIEIHIHWVPEDTTSGNTYWTLTHSWANIGAAFPNSTSMSKACPAPEVADQHTYCDLGTITGTGKRISSMIQFSLERASANALDTFNSKDAKLLEIDIHVPVNSLGSRQETVK